MNKYLIIIFILCYSALFSQIGIGTDSPEPSSVLDISSTDKGVLFPRMTLQQRDAINNPVKGLMLYCSNCGVNGQIQIYVGDSWKAISFGELLMDKELCDGIDNDGDGIIDNNVTGISLCEVCDNGVIVPKDCDDGSLCTIDSCVDGVCQYTLAVSGTPCDDGNPCTVDDTCNNGICSGNPIVCDDGNSCTDDYCDPVLGCVYVPNSNACSDGDDCTVGDYCSEGICVSGNPKLCNDNNLCTDDFCVNGDCVFTPDNSNTCTDYNPCTENDTCVNGVCSGDPINCDDGNPCTDDYCDNGVCYNVYNSDACNDGNACTENDTCVDGICTGSAINCDDGNPCTDDYCDNGVCYNVYNSNACNDGNACTTNDTCVDGVCTGDAINCDDGNPCTDDYCDNGDCVNVDNNTCFCGNGVIDFGEVCDDGNTLSNDGCYECKPPTLISNNDFEFGNDSYNGNQSSVVTKVKSQSMLKTPGTIVDKLVIYAALSTMETGVTPFLVDENLEVVLIGDTVYVTGVQANSSYEISVPDNFTYNQNFYVGYHIDVGTKLDTACSDSMVYYYSGSPSLGLKLNNQYDGFCLSTRVYGYE